MSLRSVNKLYQNRGHVRTSDPAIAPITKAELKAQLRLAADDTSEDALLDLYIGEVVEAFEEMTACAPITQTWKLTLDRWPSQNEKWWDGVYEAHISVIEEGSRRAPVRLPRFPLQSVSSITVYDDAGDSSVVDVAATFIVDTQQRPGRLVLKNGATWPIALQNSNAIEVVYVAGYGAAATDVPPALRGGLLRAAAYLYSHRGDGCDASQALTQSGAMSSLAMYKEIRV